MLTCTFEGVRRKVSYWDDQFHRCKGYCRGKKNVTIRTIRTNKDSSIKMTRNLSEVSSLCPLGSCWNRQRDLDRQLIERGDAARQVLQSFMKLLLGDVTTTMFHIPQVPTTSLQANAWRHAAAKDDPDPRKLAVANGAVEFHDIMQVLIGTSAELRRRLLAKSVLSTRPPN